MGTICFLTAWTAVMAYVLIGNYLYFAKVLPALSQDGLDGSAKFTPSAQLVQVDLYLARFSPDSPRPWFYRILLHIRIISVIVLLMMLVGWVAAALSS